MMVSQLQLVNDIWTSLINQGIATLNPRQHNSVISAADQIIEELNRPHAEAVPNMGLEAWLASDDTGISSKFMASVIYGRFPRRPGYPRDPSDFGRCVGFLEACPEVRDQIGKMKDHGPEWSALVDHWDELESLYREELPSGCAPKTYQRMKELFASDESSPNPL